MLTVKAPAGRPCCYCDCPQPLPWRLPDGTAVVVGHSERRCRGCKNPAAVVIFGGPVAYPVCTVHRGALEADFSAWAAALGRRP